jgi:glycosyltransferase involved in cell wall biosynthesis
VDLVGMTSLVFVTQLVDPDDPVLGFVVAQVRALTERFTTVVVVANEVRTVPDELGAEVVSLGKERAWGRLRRGLHYEQVIAGLARRLRPGVLLAHMCPTYLNLAAPMTKAFGMGTMLWFTHSASTATLARAERLADCVVTTFPGSYPRSSPKVRAIGHSIDTSRFSFAPLRREPGPLRLLALGRTSEQKNYPLMVRALDLARRRGAAVELRIAGPATTGREALNREELRALVDRHGLSGCVSLDEGVPPRRVPALIADADAVLNATTEGSADKVVFEAMACGRPVVTSSSVFGPLLAGLPVELRFRAGDAGDLAGRICGLAAAAPGETARIGRVLRDRVEAEHSLSHWADQVLGLAEEVVDRRPRLRGPATSTASPR